MGRPFALVESRKCATGTDERSKGEFALLSSGVHEQFKQVPQEGAKPPWGVS